MMTISHSSISGENRIPFRISIDQLLIPLVFMEADRGTYVWCNQAALELYGLSSLDELIGKTVLAVSAPIQYDGISSEDKAKYYITQCRLKGSVEFNWWYQRPNGELWDGRVTLRLFRTDCGDMIQYTLVDITDQKRSEMALQKRMNVLQSPEMDDSELDILDLFDVEELQTLQDAFADATGVASVITRTDGTPITRTSHFCRLCNMIRQTDKGRENCYHSDAIIGRHNRLGPTIQPCLSAGLYDAGASITIGDRHIANWLIGQIKNERLDDDQILSYADQIGIERESFHSAFLEITIMSKEQFDHVAQMLFIFANLLSLKAYQNLQQARVIAEKRRMEEALKTSEENLRITLYSIGDGVIATDLEGRITRMNPVAEKLTGQTFIRQGSIEFKHVMNLLHTDTRDALPDLIEQVILSGEQIVIPDCILKNHSGQAYHLSLSGAPIRNDQSIIIGVVLIFRDTSQEYRLAEQLKIQEQQFRSIFEASPLGIAICRVDDGIIYQSNPAFGKITGYPTDWIEGKSLFELFSSSERSTLQDLSHGILEKRLIENLNLRLTVSDDKSIEVLISGSIYDRNQEKCMIIIFSDITEIKSMEEQLRQSQKMEVIGQLAGGIAHDFNNMLAGVIGYTELILLQSEQDPKIKQNAEFILGSANRAADLTQKLLVFSRKAKNISVPINVHDLLHSILIILKRSIDKKISIQSDLSADRYIVNGDGTLLQNAFLNLCLNARDAMSGGGLLELQTRVLYLDQFFTDRQPGSPIPGDYIEVSVKDTGHGIPKSYLERIFKPFFTTKPVGKGTGLGLSVVYGTVRDHKGIVNVYSEEGRGTVFKIYLPLSSDTKGTDSANRLSIHYGSGVVLVIDDEKVIRSMSNDVLNYLGYETLIAEDGEEALEIFQRHKERISMVLMDMVMPKMTGLELFSRIREINPQIGILIASGYSPQGEILQILKEPRVGFIQKPFTIISMSHAVVALLPQ